MIDDALLALLACPVCLGTLSHPGEEMICAGCSARYPVRAGCPDLAPGERVTGEEWRVWQAHLENFQARREKRSAGSPVARLNRGSLLQEAFARFIQVQGGTVLDVGCGPGKFRFVLPPDLHYVGMDPLPLPETADFPFVRGLAEFLPFQSGVVDHLTVLAALDHFRQPEAFFRQVRRVLAQDGRFHLMQSIHGASSPLGLVKESAHHLKEWLEDRLAPTPHADVPRHMHAFSRSGLGESLARHFDIERETRFRVSWYRPDWLFLTLRPKRGAS